MQTREDSAIFLSKTMNKIVDFHNSHGRFQSYFVLKTIYFCRTIKPISLDDICCCFVGKLSVYNLPQEIAENVK